jgi:hypothetical protein
VNAGVKAGVRSVGIPHLGEMLAGLATWGWAEVGKKRWVPYMDVPTYVLAHSVARCLMARGERFLRT